MKSRTATVVLSAPKEKVFSYLSNIENLPEWATEFCQELKVVDGKHKVVTPMGEMFSDIHADERTGVIDMLAGSTEDKMDAFPTRVVELPEGSVYLFTLFQTPDMPDEAFQGQFESLQREFENIKRILG